MSRVLPGVPDTLASEPWPVSRLMSDDLPTLLRPMKAMSGIVSRGICDNCCELHLKVARLISMRTKIVQAECKSKLVCILPRRRLSKRKLVFRKVCKPSAEPNLFGFCRGAACLSGIHWIKPENPKPRHPFPRNKNAGHRPAFGIRMRYFCALRAMTASI